MTMEAVAKRRPAEQARQGRRDGLIASALPTLWPYMMIPRPRRSAAPFPFDEPSVHWFYFARNGIYALARLWGLAGQRILFPAYFHGVELETLLDAGVRLDFYPVHERMRVDAQEVIERITPETRAVYLIHYVGFPGPAEELAAACRERGIKLIEDCALGLLSADGPRPLGTSGDAAVFCLYKTLPTPNGGALVVRGAEPIRMPPGEPPSLASTAAHAASSLLVNLELRSGRAGRLVRQVVRATGNTASRALRAERVPTGSQHFSRTHTGLTMSRLSHVIVAAQDHATIVERRRRNFFHLLGRLRGVAAPVFSELPPGVCPLFYPMLVRDKRAVMENLERRGVEAIDFWGLSHPAVPPGQFPEADELRRNVIEIPCHQDLTPTTIDRVAQVVREVLEEVPS